MKLIWSEQDINNVTSSKLVSITHQINSVYEALRDKDKEIACLSDDFKKLSAEIHHIKKAEQAMWIDRTKEYEKMLSERDEKIHGLKNEIVDICSKIDSVCTEVREDLAKRFAENDDILDFFRDDIKALRESVEKFNKIVEGIAVDLREDVMKQVLGKLHIFEGNIDDKILGFYKSIEDKVSKGNGDGKALVGMMRRVAVLEEIKDAVEHRRKSQEILDKIDILKDKLNSLERKGDKYNVILGQIYSLEWVLGQETTKDKQEVKNG